MNKESDDNRQTNKTDNCTDENRFNQFTYKVRNSTNTYIDSNKTSIRICVATVSSILQLYMTTLSSIFILFSNGIISNKLFTDFVRNISKKIICVQEYIIYATEKLNLESHLNSIIQHTFIPNIADFKSCVTDIYYEELSARINELN